ncbi:MAG: fibrillarin-like rRNA/tRNA 2'-O-methyltransferase [Thermoplasmata archaeon]
MITPYKFEGVYTDGHRLFTRNMVPKNQVYGENLEVQDGVEYRAWNPKRSKLAAAILNGCKNVAIRNNSNVLYLGAATGTTASHISDIAVNGMVYCVEISPRAFRYLLPLCELRKNMMPILADACKTELYRRIVGGIDIVYQDIAQKDQAAIFLKNINEFLVKDGYGILIVKARSIDVTAHPKEIYDNVLKELSGSKINIQEVVNLEPYEKDHIMITCTKR